MTSQEAKRLLRNTVVKWNNDLNDLGTVLELSPTGFFVDWENGQRGWIDYKDAEGVSIR